MYLPVLQNYNHANLIAVCGRNRERANEVAAKYAIPEVYTDYRQMIEQANIDAVIVSTPDDTHYDMVMAAINAGKHVLCEKPVANNATHARKMLEKAEAKGIKHMVLFTWRWLPNMQRAKQLLDEGYLGRVYDGYFHWFAGGGREDTYSWTYDANRANGALATFGSHLIHLALWFLGDATAVTGRLAFHAARKGENGEAVPNPANDMACFTMEFANGAHAQFFMSAVAHTFVKRNELAVRLHKEKGSLQTGYNPSLTPSLITLMGKQDGIDDILTESSEFGAVDYFKSQPVGPRDFANCILDDKTCMPGLLEGYKVQQVIDAVIQSHETGCRVVIDNRI